MGSNSPRTLSDLLAWLRGAPSGMRLDAREMHDILAEIEPVAAAEPEPRLPIDVTWRERFWFAPAECRIGVHELSEALGRPKSWIYRHTSPRAIERSGTPVLPHRKLGGELVFLVGEVRAWIRENEEVVVAGPMESTD